MIKERRARIDCKIMLGLHNFPKDEDRIRIYKWWSELSFVDKRTVRDIAEEWFEQELYDFTTENKSLEGKIINSEVAQM